MIDIEKMKALAAELRDPAQKWANLASDANRAANAIDTLLSELEAREADRRRLRIELGYRGTALRNIAEQDPVEMALDPTWAKRIASAALAQRQEGEEK